MHSHPYWVRRCHSVTVMSQSTLISVIVAAHNEERYIGRCIRSLLAQTFPRQKFDIIVVNDGSTDRTATILKTFGDDVRVLHNDSNIGLPASLNKAISSTHSKFVVRVDADVAVRNPGEGVVQEKLAILLLGQVVQALRKAAG